MQRRRCSNGAELSYWRWRRSHAPPSSHCGDPARWLDRTSLVISVASVLLLALATICVPGVGYPSALVALATLTRVRPHEIEHRLLVRDLTLSSGGALLSVSPGPLRSGGIIRLLQRHRQLISGNEPNRRLSAMRPYDARSSPAVPAATASMRLW